MTTYTVDFATFEEGSIIVLPEGSYCITRLSDGTMAAISMTLSDAQRSEITRQSALSLALQQPELTELVEAQLCGCSSGLSASGNALHRNVDAVTQQSDADIVFLGERRVARIQPEYDIIELGDEDTTQAALGDDLITLEGEPSTEVQLDEDLIILEDEPLTDAQLSEEVLLTEDEPAIGLQLENDGSLLEDEGSPTNRDLQERHYFGVPDVSKRGTHTVLVYRIPDSSLCYTFALQRTTRMYQVYRCIGCYEQQNKTYTKIQVVRDIEFAADPCRLRHVCIPIRWNLEKSKRILYQRYQMWRAHDVYAEGNPKREYLKLLMDVKRDAFLSDDEKAAIVTHLHDYSSLRRNISRSLRVHDDRSVSMNNVPDELRLNPDGTRFLHIQAPDLHVYYVESIIRKVCLNGLDAVIADGVFGMHPDPKERNGQLYTLHGVCNGKVDVPILYAIANKKTEEIYLRIWGALKDALERTNGTVPDLRIVLDFERAAMKAVRRVFPSAHLECCAFHLARSWNRKRDELGLRKHLRGRTRSARVQRWWATLKGLPFLPQNLYYLVHALRHVPVPPTHPAHEKCLAFLSYLQDTWFRGPFKDTWNKWDMDILRTTNIAEGFHSALATTVRNRRPTLRKLIEVLHGLNVHAEGKLLFHELHPAAEITLRYRDLRRRRRIREEMQHFKEAIRLQSYVTAVTICYQPAVWRLEKNREAKRPTEVALCR